jgi:hypothetical protein
MTKRAMLLVVALVGCGPRRPEDLLSILPPPCKARSEPGPEGCLTILEKRESEEFRFSQAGGVVAVVFDRRSSGVLETEVTLNGTTTWTRTIRRSPEGSWLGSVVVEFQRSTGKLLREEVYRMEGAGRSVQAKSRRLGAEDDVAESSWSFELSPTSEMDNSKALDPLVQNRGCAQDELSVLQADLRRALRSGVACMRRHGRSDMGALILSRYQRGQFILACVRSRDVSPAGFLAAAEAASYLGIMRATKLSFDKESYFRSPDGARIRTLWHELLHLWAGPHAPDFKPDPRSMDLDRTNACVSLCFDKATASTCACESCLGLRRGDAQCSGLGRCVLPDQKRPDNPPVKP